MMIYKGIVPKHNRLNNSSSISSIHSNSLGQWWADNYELAEQFCHEPWYKPHIANRVEGSYVECKTVDWFKLNFLGISALHHARLCSLFDLNSKLLERKFYRRVYNMGYDGVMVYPDFSTRFQYDIPILKEKKYGFIPKKFCEYRYHQYFIFNHVFENPKRYGVK